MSDNVEEYDSTCLICLNSFLKDDVWIVRSTGCECKKNYHLNCFYNWYKNNLNCPICHKDLDKDNLLILIYNDNEWKKIKSFLICKIFEENDFNANDSIIDIIDSNQNVVIPTRSSYNFNIRCLGFIIISLSFMFFYLLFYFIDNVFFN